MQKLDIICPFCLEHTKRWKTIPVAMVTYPLTVYTKTGNVIIRRKSQEARYEEEAKIFERKVLQEHLTTCSMKHKLSPVVLEQYGLKV